MVSRGTTHAVLGSRATAVAGLSPLVKIATVLKASPGPTNWRTCSRPCSDVFTARTQPDSRT